MPTLSHVLTPAVLEFGADAVHDAVTAVQRQLVSLEFTELAILVALVVGLYLIVKHM
jgi:hypothetical protein